MHSRRAASIPTPSAGFPPSATAYLAEKALHGYLRGGDWAAAAREVGCTGIDATDAATRDAVVTLAAALWHGARVAIVRALEAHGEAERIDALAAVARDARASLGSWELVQALFERHAASPAGAALSAPLRAEALALARRGGEELTTRSLGAA